MIPLGIVSENIAGLLVLLALAVLVGGAVLVIVVAPLVSSRNG